MSNQKRIVKKIAAIAFLIGSAGLAYWGYEKSTGFESQVSNVFTGAPSDSVMLIYIASAISLAIGVFLFIKK